MRNQESIKFLLFSEEEHHALSQRTFRKHVRGKPQNYISCLVRNRHVRLTAEERTRQLWLARLTARYGYDTARLALEYPITFGRDSSKRADIVVLDADRPTVPYIIIEVKQPKLRDGKEQLRSYAHATGAPLAMWSNGTLLEVWHRKNPFPIWRSERHTARADAGAYPESRWRRAAGYFAAFFLRAAQEAFIRSDTASFSLAVIGRRFLVGVASDAVSAAGVATAAGRCEEERRAAGFAGAEAPRILSTSFNALDLRLQALDFTLPVGDCLCYNTHELPRGCILCRSTRSGRGRARSNGFGF